jgi:hypothetical protein
VIFDPEQTYVIVGYRHSSFSFNLLAVVGDQLSLVAQWWSPVELMLPLEGCTWAGPHTVQVGPAAVQGVCHKSFSFTDFSTKEMSHGLAVRHSIRQQRIAIRQVL